MAVPGLSYGMWDLYLWHANSLLWPVGSSSLSTDRTLGPLHWELGVCHWTTREVPMCVHVCVCAQSLQSYLNLCDPKDCSLVHGILQARILEWVAMPSFGRSFQPRIKPVCPVSLAL